MKRFFIVLGLLSSATAFAQLQSQTQGYNVSAFDAYSKLPMNKTAMAATQAKLVEYLPGFHATTDKVTGLVRDVYGKAMQVPGKDIDEKSAYVIANKLDKFGVKAAEWVKTNNVDASHASYTHYEQYIDGHKVAFSQLTLRYTTDGMLQRIVMKNYGNVDNNTAPAIDNKAVYNLPVMLEGLAGISVSSKNVANEWEWFPIPSVNKYIMHPAWAFNVYGTDNKTNMPIEIYGYIDAITGELLYRMNEVKEEVNLVVNGNVYKDGYLNPATIQPLSNLAITIGSNTANTDDTGFYRNTAVNLSQNATVKLAGKWSTVKNITSGGTNPSFVVPITANGGSYTFQTTSPSGEQHVNAYYHTNRMHDHAKKLLPSAFTGIDISLTTVVDVASTTGCNAFYGGNAINFYAENSSCNSFAKVGDIIYHEYGHFINSKFYNYIKGSGGMTNGGLNEGYADVWAMTLTKDPVLGKGAFKSGGNIRTYGPTGTTKIYPYNRTSEVHANGEIIAGAWWDISANLGSVDSMASLFAKGMFDIVDGPEGTEGEVYHEALIAALINDDDDANLTNGTPHFLAITTAFAKHGIYLFSDAKLEHTEIANQQVSQEGKPVSVEANITVTEPAYFDKIKLVYRNRANGSWDTVAMTNGGAGATGGVKFQAEIPGQSSGTIVDYYFITYDTYGNAGFSFPNGFNTFMGGDDVTLPYQFAIGVYKKAGVDFDTPVNDWKIANVSGDNATSGKWIQAVPVASYWKPTGASYIHQPGNDHTSGTGSCLVTGNASSSTATYNTADVDGGKTTVVTPVFDISGYANPIIEYYRWFANDQGPRDSNPRTDPWATQIRDSTSVLWRYIELTYQSDYAWRRKIFKVRDFLSASNYIQMRFIASDEVNAALTSNGETTVEAAVDDFAIYDAWPVSVGAEPKLTEVKVFPNPADNTINVTVTAGTKGTLALFDMTGRQLVKQELSDYMSNYIVNTSHIANGSYFLVIQTDKSIQSKKVVVKH